MTKKETLDLLKEVLEYYPHFLDTSDTQTVQRRLDAWHRALKSYDYSSLLDKLTEYAMKSDFPPKVSDLVKGLSVPNTATNIPDKEETKKYLDEIEGKEVPNTDDPQLQAIKEQIKKGLGI